MSIRGTVHQVFGETRWAQDCRTVRNERRNRQMNIFIRPLAPIVYAMLFLAAFGWLGAHVVPGGDGAGLLTILRSLANPFIIL